ncbi:hypothetical protein TorRG33x02_115500 [Trema orientale]|uniref:Uncharacterized protein n=1 Tax=Trema orientale TaxID=63057 RepID=A0A2P5F4G8_TREOI|nr:hypothetical protein TorRG33x02_115500 [Trema orientale]
MSLSQANDECIEILDKDINITFTFDAENESSQPNDASENGVKADVVPWSSGGGKPAKLRRSKWRTTSIIARAAI